VEKLVSPLPPCINDELMLIVAGEGIKVYMKIKIILAGKNESRHKFVSSLVESLKSSNVKLDKFNASLNAVGTGSYHFKLGNDDIELLYIENEKRLRPNYKAYAKDANALILVDADDETKNLLVKACPLKIARAHHNGGGKIDGMKGVSAVVDKIHKREAKLKETPNVTAAPHAQFYRHASPAIKPAPTPEERMQTLQKFLEPGAKIREYQTRSPK
jgi:hypothetical protein